MITKKRKNEGRIPWNKGKKGWTHSGSFKKGHKGYSGNGEANSNWKGGIKLLRGYIQIYEPEHPSAVKNYVYEHRLVVEEYIGRRLTKEEVVHHIDENRSNNKIENLMLFENNKTHMSFHTKIRQFGITNPIRRQIQNRWLIYKKEGPKK